MGNAFEYKIIDVSSMSIPDQESLFRNLGFARWELVTVHTKLVSAGASVSVAYFKKPVQVA